MDKPVIPFTLEQEASYREQIQDLFSQQDNAQFRSKADVLTNMLIFEIVKAINARGEIDGVNFIENNRDYIDDVLADFSCLSFYITDWLEDEELKDYRLLIEEREKKIAGKALNTDNFESTKKEMIHQEILTNHKKPRRKKPLGFGQKNQRKK
ncbi:MAG TPA: hypothetical protein ACFCUY_03305 [Xenococcaceae cyanobacterium]|jgi:hypothetical protein